MLSKSRALVEYAHVFVRVVDKNLTKFIIGVATGVNGLRAGVAGTIVNPVGLYNKVTQGKAGAS